MILAQKVQIKGSRSQSKNHLKQLVQTFLKCLCVISISENSFDLFLKNDIFFTKEGFYSKLKQNIPKDHKPMCIIVLKKNQSLQQYLSQKVQTCTNEISIGDSIIHLQLFIFIFKPFFFWFSTFPYFLSAPFTQIIFHLLTSTFVRFGYSQDYIFNKPKININMEILINFKNLHHFERYDWRQGCVFYCKEQLMNNINNFTMKGSKSIYKYSKVTQQQKFHLLTLVLHQKLLIKQAAKIVGINYSTAKTIMFFNKNSSKSYQFSFRNSHTLPQNHQHLHASYKVITSFPDQDPNTKVQSPKIMIINTIGNEKAVCRTMIHNKRLYGDHTKRMRYSSGLNQIRDDSGYGFDQYINNQKDPHYPNMQRPRTRSQRNGFNYFRVCKLQHQKKDFQSSGVPQMEES